ncbi:elongation of very long chain fatty acids protein 6-like isoform X2 [Corticium candelabrum]|uniref:elongation of very long chain fatty acids protein 6-like isoform X2 n=1 Tax=Corticium candelabrum TaxID=121492 RepID=UPI002E25F2B0|nr:elongation of very long chain fatty acids protein 6-like isoform X2 [Corticium candelabrum]
MDFSQTIFFDVEQRFSKYNTQKWMNMWWTFCFYISAVYVVIVHWGQNLMTNRKKFYLRRPLFLWNLTLACFSAIGFYRVGGKFLDDLERYGWHQTICSLEWLEGQSGLWCALFGYSKVLELLDTSFIILRKQKLIFLHWYHHITVLCFCWYAYIYPHGQAFSLLHWNWTSEGILIVSFL